MIDNITVYISFTLTIIGIISLLIVAWQYFTGRPYWGENENSLIIPTIIATIIPGLNLLWYTILTIFAIVGLLSYITITLREMAVERRNGLMERRELEKIKKYNEDYNKRNNK